jgi:23S rRNA (guanosine2251-2'-O)-methyltransferase
MREDDRVREVSRLAQERGAEIETIPRLMLDDATRGANHQGIALEAEAYRYSDFDQMLETPGSILVLDHLQDPQNLGTLLRAAEAAGIAGVVMPQNRTATITPAVVNASAGAVEHLRVATMPNLAQALESLRGSGRWIVGLDTGPGSSNLFTTIIPTPAALIVGAEGPGLSPLLRKRCDLVLSLPMHGKIASLNASTAGAIAMYELLRQDDAARAADRGKPH